MNTIELFQAGDLTGALSAAVGEVKSDPTDVAARYRFCELLCFAGDWDRAATHLNAIFEQEPSMGGVVALVRQLMRAAEARERWLTEGTRPELVEPSGEDVELRLKAAEEQRAGNAAAAKELLDQAESMRSSPAGTLNGEPFDEWRDLDDMTAACAELLTADGRYSWIPWGQIESLDMEPPQRPLDTLWRPIKASQGKLPAGRLYMPVLYVGSSQSDDDRIRLGRFTDWRGEDGEPIRGVGRREFLTGDVTQSVLAIEQLVFES